MKPSMSAGALRKWAWIHKWTSLVCMAFLLVICITGLPLIFAGEINEAALPSREPAPVALGDRRVASLDRMIAASRARFPGQSIVNVALDDDEPIAFIGIVPSFEAAEADPKLFHWIKFDTRTGAIINTSEKFQYDVRNSAGSSTVSGFMNVMVRLHVDLFARLPGNLFLGFMGVLFLAAIISGVVLYAPFTRKLEFGAVRGGRSRRVHWLDLHNLLGIVTLAWASVVGFTGALNEIAGPLNKLWMNTEVKAVFDPWRGRAPPRQSEMSSVQAAFDTARRALPGMKVTYLAFPKPKADNVYHYWLWARGNTHLTEHLSTAVLIDARSGEFTEALQMPWYLRAVELSRPLHFGNYGGLPLKILWALLDLVTIVVLASGLYLWLAKRRRAPSAAAVTEADPGPVELLAAAE